MGTRTYRFMHHDDPGICASVVRKGESHRVLTLTRSASRSQLTHSHWHPLLIDGESAYYYVHRVALLIVNYRLSLRYSKISRAEYAWRNSLQKLHPARPVVSPNWISSSSGTAGALFPASTAVKKNMLCCVHYPVIYLREVGPYIQAHPIHKDDRKICAGRTSAMVLAKPLHGGSSKSLWAAVLLGCPLLPPSQVLWLSSMTSSGERACMHQYTVSTGGKLTNSTPCQLT